MGHHLRQQLVQRHLERRAGAGRLQPHVPTVGGRPQHSRPRPHAVLLDLAGSAQPDLAQALVQPAGGVKHGGPGRRAARAGAAPRGPSPWPRPSRRSRARGDAARRNASNAIGSTMSACARSCGSTHDRSTRRPTFFLRSSMSVRGVDQWIFGVCPAGHVASAAASASVSGMPSGSRQWWCRMSQTIRRPVRRWTSSASAREKVRSSFSMTSRAFGGPRASRDHARSARATPRGPPPRRRRAGCRPPRDRSPSGRAGCLDLDVARRPRHRVRVLGVEDDVLARVRGQAHVRPRGRARRTPPARPRTRRPGRGTAACPDASRRARWMRRSGTCAGRGARSSPGRRGSMSSE